MTEPRSELARYAFGYSDRKPGWLFWLIHLAMLAFIAWAVFSGNAFACHRFSVWKYPWAQRCAVAPDKTWFVEVVLPPEPDIDIPLPSLDGMEFPPDATGDDGDRLKGIGLLRQLRGTN
jgi:hypothetical protein